MGDRPRIFGVLNVTPDSFSDGGLYLDAEAAVRAALRLVEEGADYVDVGGESTRPGAERVTPEVEQDRVLPVIATLAERGVRVSVDTMNSGTAAAAVAEGAVIVNDVSGGAADPDMAAVIAEEDVSFVVMHSRGASAAPARYGDVVAEVRAELAARVEALTAAGVRAEQLILDPGIGFAKDADANWRLLGALPELATLGRPLLVGVSRKRFLGALPSLAGAPVEGRDVPTAVVSALLALADVWAVRVHDVAGTAAALDVVDAWRGGSR